MNSEKVWLICFANLHFIKLHFYTTSTTENHAKRRGFFVGSFPAVPEQLCQPAVRERSSRGTGANFAVPLAECPCPTGKQIRGENAKGVEPFAQVRCPKTRKRVRGSQEKRPFSNGLFSIQSEGLACNHDAVMYVIAVGDGITRQRAFSFGLIPCITS